jgi:hypothetical protein
MTTNNAQAQTTPKTIPDFSHRLDGGYDVNSISDLYEAANAMVLRSKGILSIIADLHAESHTNEINGENVCWALSGVKRELDDLLALIEARL